MPLGNAPARFTYYRTPYDYETIKEGIESIKDDGGGKLDVKQGTYIEQPTEMGNIPIIVEFNNSIIKPSADNDLTYYLNGLPTWGSKDEEIVPILRNPRFYNDLYTGCTAIEIQDLIGASIERPRVEGTSSKPWLEGIRLDATSGQWTEMIDIDRFYFDHVTTGLHALATTGVNSLDHCRITNLEGNLRADGDIGMHYASTVDHANKAVISGQMFCRPATCTGWKMAGRLSRIDAELGVEVTPTSPAKADRIGVDLTGCDALLAKKIMVYYVGDDTDYTDIVKGDVRTYNLFVAGQPALAVGPTGLIDPTRFNPVLYTDWAEPIYESNQFAPIQGGEGRCTLGENGISKWDILVIDDTVSNDPIKCEADVHKVPFWGQAMAAGDLGDNIPLLQFGVSRRDGVTYNEGKLLYQSETEGAMTETPPVTSGSIVNIVGQVMKSHYTYMFLGGYFYQIP